MWTGLRDNPTLYPEVSDLGRRLAPLKAALAPLHRQADAYAAPGAYVSTLSNGSGTYLVVANRSCGPAGIAVAGSGSGLRDLETGTVYPMGGAIPFRGGDGRLFQVVP
jgi:hypothetical protein